MSPQDTGAPALTPTLTVTDGKVTAISTDVAERFVKRHDTVLRAIKNLDCSPEFNARNFAAVEYIDAKGQRRPAYRMTRSGFSFLCMGFTGKEAAVWKERYIDAFDTMEAKLAAVPPEPTLPPPDAGAEAAKLLSRTRWMMWFDDGKPALIRVEPKAVLLAPEEFANYLREPGEFPRALLFDVIQACTERLRASL